MADQLYLSYWLRGFGELGMLPQFERMLAAFPYSKLARTDAVLRVHAVGYHEPPLLETAMPAPADASTVVQLAGEFRNADCCYELSADWDLWRRDGGWKLAPSRVILSCYGEEFEHQPDDHLRIDFGLEDQFLPAPGERDAAPMIRANIQSLLRLVHDLDGLLPMERRQLWSENGENFANRLQNALASDRSDQTEVS